MIASHSTLFHRIAAAIFLVGCLAWLGGCADDLVPQGAPDAGPTPDGGGNPTFPNVTHSDEGSGVTETVIDATAQDAWIFVDLDTKAEVEESGAWDLAFQRFHIKLHAEARGAILPGVEFTSIGKAPATGFQADSAGFSVFESGDGWYGYNPTTHAVTPRDIVYVVESGDGAHFKLQLTAYYDDAGTSAHPTFRWAPVDAPPASDAITVAATSQTDWKYLRIADGAEVFATDAWDLAFRRFQIATHGGTSGPDKFGGARIIDAPYDEVVASDSVGFAKDVALTGPPPGFVAYSGNPVLEDWYDYTTGAPVSRGLTYVIRTATGGYGKLTITGWADGTFTVRVAPLPRSLATHTLSVAAPAGPDWVHVDLRGGTLVEPETPATDPSWDLAFNSVYLATNSGTSGAGGGGAADAMVEELGFLVGDVSGMTYAVDSELELVPPASGAYSGNASLERWYDYDMVTHTASPKANVYVVRTADGGYAKVLITAYDGDTGAFTLDYVYAGAGQGAF